MYGDMAPVKWVRPVLTLLGLLMLWAWGAWTLYLWQQHELLRAAWAAHVQAQPAFTCTVELGRPVLCWREGDVVRSAPVGPGTYVCRPDAPRRKLRKMVPA